MESSQRSSLFPIMSTSDQERPLFPAFSGDTDESSVRAPNHELDWLQNSSFKSQDAVIIHQLRKIREADSAEHQDSNDSISSLTEHKATKRDHSTSASDSDSSPEKKRHKVKKEKKKKKKKKKHKHKHISKSDRSESPPSKLTPKDSLSEVPGAKGKVFLEELAGLNIRANFRIDRTPDVNNITYGSLYKLHIARYRRVGNSALGLDGDVKLFGSSKSHSQNKSISRYYDRENRIPHDYSKSWVVNSTDGTQGSSSVGIQGFQTDFIAVTLDHKVPERSQVNPLGIYDTSTEMYLRGPENEETDEPEEIDNKSESHSEYLRRRTAEYNSYLYKNPHDIEKWLEFIKFQDESAPVISDNTGTKKVAEKNLLEIKASVMDKALAKNPGCIRLRLAQLELCVPLWESERVTKEWNQLLFLHPDNPIVWRQYLQFQCSQFGRFTMSRMVKSYAKCLAKLDQVRSGSLQSHTPHPHTERHMISLFCELCMLLWQGGHMERSTALCQAMLELNLNCPAVLADQGLTEKKEFLEAFWGSSAPRLGEDDSKGWATWVDTKGEVPHKATYVRDDEEKTEEDLITNLVTLSRDKAWNSLEVSRTSRHWLPWRPDFSQGESEEDCEDPDRLVLFDDVVGCLFLIHSEAGRLELVVSFLKMLDSPASWAGPASCPLVQGPLRNTLDSTQQIVAESNFHGNCNAVELDSSLQTQVVTNFLLQIVPNFSPAAKSKLLVTLLGQKMKEFEKCSSNLKGKELKKQVKELRGYVKGILKEEPARSDLLLWKSFAQLEWTLGSKEDACKVMDNAIAMFVPSVTNVTENYTHSVACNLYRTYTEMELCLEPSKIQGSNKGVDKQSKQKALYLVASLASGEKYKPFVRTSGNSNTHLDVPAIKILKAQKNYPEYLGQLLSQVQSSYGQPEWENKVLGLPEAGSVLVHWTACYAMFQYLTVDISAAKTVYEHVLEQLEPPGGKEDNQAWTEWDSWSGEQLWRHWLYEQVQISFVKLLRYHLATGVCPLQTVRGPLLKALTKLPDQPTLLQMYIKLEAGMGVTGQLKRHLLRIASSAKTPLPWLYGALAELRRIHKRQQHQQEGMELASPSIASEFTVEPSAQYQLRAWFEKAVSEPVGQHCVLLWRLYFHVEVQQGQLQYAKSVFYRAVQQCPWAKMLYMDLIQHFPAQLQEAMDLMAEKEIRVRAPLEELDLLLESARNPELTNAEIHEEGESSSSMHMQGGKHEESERPVEMGPT